MKELDSKEESIEKQQPQQPQQPEIKPQEIFEELKEENDKDESASPRPNVMQESEEDEDEDSQEEGELPRRSDKYSKSKKKRRLMK